MPDAANIFWRACLTGGIITMLAGCALAVGLLWRHRLRPFTRNMLIVLALSATVVGLLYIYTWFATTGGFTGWFLNIDGEHTLAAHFSTLQLLLIGVVAFMIGWRTPTAAWWQRLYWLALAGAFTFMGIDEYTEIHEWLFDDDRWRILYAGGGVVMALATLWMYRRVYPQKHTVFLLLFDGLIIMGISGILIEYAVWNSFCYDTPGSLVPVCERFNHWLIFEEWFEIFGATIVLSAFLLMAQAQLNERGWRVQRWAVVVAGVLAAVSMVGYLWLLPALEARYATPVEVTYLDGTLELVGYRIGRETAHPGDSVPITLYWRAHDESFNSVLRLSLHAIAKPDLTESIAQVDEIDIGQYPSRAFLPGVVVRKTLELTLPDDLPTPSSHALMLRVWSGNWQRQEMRGQAVTQANRPLLTPDSLLFDSLVILAPDTPGALNGPAVYNFGTGFSLAGYSLPETASGPLEITFAWQTHSAGTADLSQFVHLIDEASGEFVYGFDQPPFAGALPTADWPANSRLQDTWSIPLPDDLPAGDYTVLTGLYDPVTLERLPVTEASGAPVANNAVPLGRVRVQ